MRLLTGILGAIVILATTTVAGAASDDSGPLLSFSSYSEINGSVYSEFGRYDPDRDRFLEYTSEDYTQYPIGEDDPAGIPITVSVFDGDDGRIIMGYAEILGNARQYQIYWSNSVEGEEQFGPTGMRINGQTFIPLEDYVNIGTQEYNEYTVKISVLKYEDKASAIAGTPLGVPVEKTATFSVDTRKPSAVVSVGTGGEHEPDPNTLIVEEVTKSGESGTIPAYMNIEFMDTNGSWSLSSRTLIEEYPHLVEFDSLWIPERTYRVQFEDLVGNKTEYYEDTLTVSSEQRPFYGKSSDNRMYYYALINTRFGESQNINQEFIEFVSQLVTDPEEEED